MTPVTHAVGRKSTVEAALARDRLGIPAVVFFVMSGVAPLTVVAGVIPTAYAVTGMIAIPAAFLVLAVILAIFSTGYVAMARHIKNAGAFYAFISRGLGRSAGVGAAVVAVVAYNLLQVGLYGAFGPGAASFAAEHFHINVHWWIWSLGAWVLTAAFGLSRVEVTGRLLAVLLSIEILVTIALTVSGLMHPANHHVSFKTLEPSGLAVSGVGAALAVAVLGFVGFEGAAVLTEEAKHPRRTIPGATYISVVLITVLYGGASWALAVHYGTDGVVQAARDNGPGATFMLGNQLLSNMGQVLYLTSIFAAMLAFHSFVTRYMFSLGREGVLPRSLANTSRSGAPKSASIIQSAFGLLVIVIYALAGWDPLVKLFFWLGTTGGVGVLLLIVVTSLAVPIYFFRTPNNETVWHRVFAPVISFVALVVVTYLVLKNYATLLGVPPGSPVAKWLPSVYLVAAVAGVIWAFVLRNSNYPVWRSIGWGAEADQHRDAAIFSRHDPRIGERV